MRPPNVERPTLNLDQTSPTAFTTHDLQQQLVNAGLDCSQINHTNLQSYIDEVQGQIPNGYVQAMTIYAPSDVGGFGSAQENFNKIADGHWSLNTDDHVFFGQYDQALQSIVNKEYFEFLIGNDPGFNGSATGPTQYGPTKYDNADAIKQLFEKNATNASATLLSGIDQDSMLATMTRVIKPITDDVKDYDQYHSRYMTIVDNYNPANKTFDAIGALRIDWHLVIENYTRKEKHGGDQHNTTLTISARAALFEQYTHIQNDYNKLVAQYGLDPIDFH